jgi:hypothetical protein
MYKSQATFGCVMCIIPWNNTAGKQQFHVETQWQEHDLLQNFTLEESPAIGEAKCFNLSPKDLRREIMSQIQQERHSSITSILKNMCLPKKRYAS